MKLVHNQILLQFETFITLSLVKIYSYYEIAEMLKCTCNKVMKLYCCCFLNVFNRY